MERERVGLRLPHDLNLWLFYEAKRQGVTKNALVAQILRSRMEKEGQQIEESRVKAEISENRVDF